MHGTWITYTKKPLSVEARLAWSGEKIHTMEGVVYAKAGDMVVRGVLGEVYVVDRQAFAMAYEEAGGELPTRLLADGGG